MSNSMNENSIKPKNLHDGLENMSYDAGKKLGKLSNDLASYATDHIDAGRTYVRENPAAGIAIAVGAGVVVGSLLTLMMRSK